VFTAHDAAPISLNNRVARYVKDSCGKSFIQSKWTRQSTARRRNAWGNTTVSMEGHVEHPNIGRTS